MNKWTSILSAACMALMLSESAFCQLNSGTITGAVKDPSGALIPGVQVTVVQAETNFVTNALTGEDGRYRVPSLLPGPYRITFELPGFKRFVREGVQLRVGDVLPVDVTLEIGELSDQIEVSAQATMLQTETSSAGTLTEGDTLYNMPLYQRNVATALSLVPAVVAIQGVNYRISTYNIAGQRSSATAVFEDGTFGVDPQASSTSIRSVGNSVEEVKVLTSTLSAEYGHTAGGVMEVVKKSGTNSFHGSVTAYGRSRIMSHRLFFSRYKDTQPQPGAPNGVPGFFLQPDLNVSGPLIIPGLYDGRNKSFFSFSYLKLVEKLWEARNGTTTSPDLLAGDFTFGGLGNVLYDPATTRQLPDGTWTRDPFPSRKLPEDRIDPVAKRVIGYAPWNPPNTPGSFTSTGPVSNFYWLSNARTYRDNFSGRFDQQFSAKLKVYAGVTYNDDSGIPRPAAIRNPAFDGGSGTSVPLPTQSYSVGASYIISPTTLNDLRVGYFRIYAPTIVPSYNQNWGTKLGIPNISPALMPAFSSQTSPRNLDAPVSAMYGLTVNGPSLSIRETVSFRDDLSKTLGGHSFKTGYELLNFSGNFSQVGQPSGTFEFDTMTAGLQPNGQPIPNTGNDFAGFLLGYVRQATFSSYTTSWLPRDRIHSLYFQDDWKVTPDLTLNLGMRWSTESPFHTAHGLQSNFDPNAIDPLTGKQGAIVHPTGFLSARDLKNFQPRFGIAWHPLNRWVFRGGFGLNTIDMRWPNALQQFDEYQALHVQQRLPGDPLPIFRISDGPAPVAYNIAADHSASYVGTNYGSRNVTWIVSDLHPSYALNWNTTLEMQMSTNNLLRLTYQGSTVVGLPENWNINVFPTSFAANDPALRARAFAAPQNYFPYPQFGRISQLSNSGHSTYHSGTLQYEKRYSSGLVLSSFYTFSKVIDQCDSETGLCTGRKPVENRRLEKGRAGFDQNHRFVTSATYELPLGTGKRFLNHGLGNTLFGGFSISWVQTFASGNPLSFSFTNSPNNYYPTAIGTRVPDLVGPRPEMRDGWRDLGPNRFDQSLANAVIPVSGFAYPATFTAGNAGRNITTGPGFRFSNVSAKRTFKINEQLNAHIRWDFQNAFHNYGFGPPTTTVDFKNPNLFGKLTTEGTTVFPAGQPLMMITAGLNW